MRFANPLHAGAYPCTERVASRARILRLASRGSFVLTVEGQLKYWKKSQHLVQGKPPSGELELGQALVSVEGADARSYASRFTVENKERSLSLRAETDVERSSWVCALLAAGAHDHPLSTHLPSHVVQQQRRAGSTDLPSTLSIAVKRAGSRRTFVDVPPGARAGGRFEVEVPTVRVLFAGEEPLRTHTLALSHTHSLSLSLSLSHTHTHTHTHAHACLDATKLWCTLASMSLACQSR